VTVRFGCWPGRPYTEDDFGPEAWRTPARPRAAYGSATASPDPPSRTSAPPARGPDPPSAGPPGSSRDGSKWRKGVVSVVGRGRTITPRPGRGHDGDPFPRDGRYRPFVVVPRNNNKHKRDFRVVAVVRVVGHDHVSVKGGGDVDEELRRLERLRRFCFRRRAALDELYLTPAPAPRSWSAGGRRPRTRSGAARPPTTTGRWTRSSSGPACSAACRCLPRGLRNPSRSGEKVARGAGPGISARVINGTRRPGRTRTAPPD
jgi:hypothetical protein